MAELTATVEYSGDDLFAGKSATSPQQTIETKSERGLAATPMEMLLLALGGCMGVDVVGILRKKRQEVTAYRIELRGERRQEFPRSFQKIQMHHVLTGPDLSVEAVQQALDLSDKKYCSVAATLRPTADISSTFEIRTQSQAA